MNSAVFIVIAIMMLAAALAAAMTVAAIIFLNGEPLPLRSIDPVTIMRRRLQSCGRLSEF